MLSHCCIYCLHQSEDEDSNVYSTANSKWAVLESYKQGSVLELKLVISAHQWVSEFQISLHLTFVPVMCLALFCI